MYTTTLPYGCSWSAVLEAVCKATGIQSSGDISHLIPLVNGAVVTDKSGDQILVVDRFQFWATVKRSNNANESLVWEVYVTGKGYGQPSQQPAKAVKGSVLLYCRIVACLIVRLYCRASEGETVFPSDEQRAS